jgi:hypothetical protein
MALSAVFLSVWLSAVEDKLFIPFAVMSADRTGCRAVMNL